MRKAKCKLMWLLVLAAVIGWIPNLAAHAAEVDPVEIIPDAETTVTIETGGEIVYFGFTPEYTESYTFYSSGDLDTYGYLYDSEMNGLASDDDSGGSQQFSVKYTLEAGETYIFGARCYSNSVTGSFTVVLKTDHTLESVVTTTPTCTEEGLMTHTCTTCGFVYTESIPMEHTYENGFCTLCGAERIITGTCGEEVTWRLDGYGTLTISGAGAMESYDTRSGAPWYAYRADIRKIVIESGVTRIGQYAFYEAGAEAAEIPDTVTSIYSYAFWDCVNLLSVEIPEGVVYLNTAAFSGCESLERIILPDSLEYIGSSAFSSCYALQEIDIPENVTQIGGSAFMYCRALEEIEIPDGVTILNDNLFYGCENLTSIVLPDSVERIGERVFQDCYSLRQLVIPEHVIFMDRYVFARLESLEKVFFLGDEPRFVDADVFSICKANFTVYHLADASGWEGTEWYGKPLAVWDYTYSGSASCTEPSDQTFTSEEHGLVYTRHNKDPEHRCTEWTVGQEATSEADGWWEGICTLCGEIVRKTIPMRAQAEDAPASTTNNGWQNYIQASPTIRSHLIENSDGSLTRVEYTGEQITIETYDENLEFQSRIALVPELEHFGGYYTDGTYHYIVYGQSNPDCDNEREVIRFVRYSDGWNRIDSVSLYGANTRTPFSAGSLRMVHYGDMLYVSTCHLMYNGHQASMLFSVYLPKMKIIETVTGVAQDEYGYVSHSFNQFIAAEETGQIVKVDHGDGYPRSFYLNQFTDYEGGLILTGNASLVEMMEFTGSTGNNYTGASLGGFEITSSHYMIAGNSIPQDGTVSLQKGQRNIFIAVTPKADMTQTATEIVWMTDYADGSGVSVSTPQLVRVGSDSYLILWTEGDVLYYAFVDGTGKLNGQIYTAEGRLSNCKPLLSGNRVIWYVTADSVPEFYVIDLDQPDQVRSSHSHDPAWSITQNPTYSEEGTATAYCKICGEEMESVVIPIVNDADYTLTVTREPTCIVPGDGYYTWNCTDYGTVKVNARLYALGHSYGEWYTTTEPTCTQRGEKRQDCVRCTDYVTQTVNSTGHSYGDTPEYQWAEDYSACTASFTCVKGDDEKTVSCTVTSETTPATTMEEGKTVYTATVEFSGQTYTDTQTVMIPVLTYLKGDINGDGNVNNRDAARLMQYLAGWDVEYVEAALDVNGDGKINNRDAARLMQYLAGWDVEIS